MDDILDFTQTSEQLGKPAGSDLASGNLTAPTLYALRHPVHGPALRELIESEFSMEGGLDRALELVRAAGGIDAAKELARDEGETAKQCLAVLPDSEARRSLVGMVDYVLDRLF